MLCVAKAMGGGFPMGAVLCSDKIKPPTGNHGSTFGGNPLACAAGLATIKYIEEKNLVNESKKKGEFLLNILKEMKLKRVREIRGMGLMIGIELKEKVKPLILKLIKEGVLTLPAGSTVLRLLPPLTITYKQLNLLSETIEKVLHKI
jgi:acetylornithine/LysW-gamma-L-lysine aminotransferase